MSDHQHYTDCHLHHFACALERIRELERQLSHKGNLSTRSGNTFTGPVYLGAPQSRTGSPLPPPVYVTSPAVIPCGDAFYTHHGDEPPSATP